MALAHAVTTQEIRDLYLDQRWAPLTIARKLGCSPDVVKHRLVRSGATSDPRAALPFRRPDDQAPVDGYSVMVLLRAWIARDGRPVSHVGRAAGLNDSTLNRIVRGGRAPSAETCGHLADALTLTTTERDRLYVAAGHAPPTLMRLGGWSDPLARFCLALLDEEG